MKQYPRDYTKTTSDCPHCGSINTIIMGLAITDKKICWRCNVCRKPFETKDDTGEK